MPTIETSVALLLVLGGDTCFVEGGVGGVFQLHLVEALVIIHDAVTDELDLRYARNGLEVRVEDGFDFLSGLVVAVTIALTGWVKCLKAYDMVRIFTSLRHSTAHLCQSILLFRREVSITEQQCAMLQVDSCQYNIPSNDEEEQDRHAL